MDRVGGGRGRSRSRNDSSSSMRTLRSNRSWKSKSLSYAGSRPGTSSSSHASGENDSVYGWSGRGSVYDPDLGVGSQPPTIAVLYLTSLPISG